jgi:hypothetical protein
MTLDEGLDQAVALDQAGAIQPGRHRSWPATT